MVESEPKVYIPESFQVNYDVSSQIKMIWDVMKAPLIVPFLNACVYISLAMALMLFMERVYMGFVIILVKLFWKKPEQRYKYEPLQDDEELGGSNFPVVLVQIPMFNEREVYKVSIGAACGLSWPTDRLVIQVLDDSTDPVVKQMVEMECQRWASKGINITYQIRETRGGYKAGALKEGLKRSYVKHCEYVVIFDADFSPPPDFLRRAIPFLVGNPEIALVQGRWRFVNANECLLTRMQEMSLDYHFTVEQEVGSATHAFSGANRFFFYNGLYGVGVVNGNIGGNVIPPILNPSQQLGNIYYIYSSNGPSSIVITPVLNHSNYHVWAHSMRKAHGGKNKFDLVDGSILVHWSLIQVSRLGIVATCLCIFGL